MSTETATPSPMQGICTDLRVEYDTLDQLVAPLTAEQWNQLTPFYKWTIYDEIAHLYYFDSTALLATTSREDFAAHAPGMNKELIGNDSFADIINRRIGVLGPVDLLNKWRIVRDQLLKNLEILGPKDRLPWYGPDMSALSFTTARLMETWAHGQDVYDAIRSRRETTDRIRSIAHLGVSTFAWTFKNRCLKVPEHLPTVNLRAPSGGTWRWDGGDSVNYVNGSAEEFCLVVTQRRNIADTNLQILGKSAKRWMEIAQCFAGPVADGPAPGQRKW